MTGPNNRHLDRALSLPVLAGLAAIVLLIVAWAAIIQRAGAYEREAFQATEQNLSNLSLAFEEGLSRSIKAVDQAIISVRDLYAGHGLTAEVKHLTAILTQSDPTIVSLGLTGPDGDISYLVNRGSDELSLSPSGAVNIGDREHFLAQTETSADQLHIGKPSIGRINNRWLVFLTRRIARADGSFGGVVIATLDAEQMAAFYKKIDIGPQGVVTVIGDDGIARVRVATGTGARFGDDLRGTPVVTKAADIPIGITISTSKVDNTERMLAHRRIRDVPLFVTIASGMAPIRRGVRERQLSLYLTGGAVTLTILVLAGALAWHGRREQDRRRQARLIEAVFENMGEGITVVDRDLRLVAWNDRLAGLIGVDPATLRPGAPLRDILMSQAAAGEFGPGDLEKQVARRLRDYAAPERAVVTRVRPDGSCFESRRRALPDGGYVTLFLDITELKHAEAALRAANTGLEHMVAERTAALAASERRLSRAQDIAGVGHWVRTGGTVEYSPAAAAIFGAEPDALAVSDPDYLERFVHPADRAKVAEAGRSGGELLEYRIVRPDGGVRSIAEKIDVADGETIGTIHDITDVARAERELEAARAILLDAIESVGNAFVLYDRDDRVLLFNEMFLEHFNAIRDRIVVGMRYEDMFRLASESGCMAIPEGETLDSFVAAGVAVHRRANGARFLRHRADGRVFEIWENRARNGGIVAVGLEVTERLRVEGQLRQAQRMEAIGTLTGGIAHDFNNLLGVVAMNLESLAAAANNDARTAASIADSLTAVASGAGLTQRLLAFARRQNLAPAIVAPNALISQLAGLMRRVLGETISISLDLAPDVWPVFIDPAQLEASVLNLATNARDAMPDGGQLILATRNLRIGAAEAAAWPELEPGDHVEIAVTDTGTGMTAEIKSQIFEPFFTTKDVGHGSGLGLSMVFGFLKQSKGLIAVDSVPGEGTTFRLFLPRSMVDPPAEAPPVAALASGPGGETILVVEDNTLLRISFSRQLVSLGYRVEEAADAQAALAMLENGGVDLVLSDVLMPGKMNGAGLAREIGARWPSIGVILTSGFADDQDRDDSGVRFLAKPVRRQVLARAIRETLDA